MKNSIIKSFKSEFRLMSADTWHDAIEANFEVLGHMFNRGLQIPEKYEYNAGVGDPTEEDSYFHEFFNHTSDKDLAEIAEFLHRYCNYLRFKGVSY